MPKQVKKESAKEIIADWVVMVALVFCTASSAFLLVRNLQTQELSCKIKVVDAIRELVLLECEK
jgi:hypothetical protein